MDTQVDSRTFTCFNNFFFHLFTHFGYYLFDTCRMDTSVSHKLMECQAGNFTTNRVKSRKYDSFRSVVYYDLNTGSSFQRTNITSFTTDNSSLDFVRFNMEYSYRVFNSSFSSYSLDRLNHNTFCFLAGSQFGIIHNIVDVRLCQGFSLLFQRLYQTFFSFFSRQTGNSFQFLDFLMLQFIQFFLFLIYYDKLSFQVFLYSFRLHFLTLNLFLALVKDHFTLFQLVLSLLNLLVTQCHFLFQISFLVQELLLHFQ